MRRVLLAIAMLLSACGASPSPAYDATLAGPPPGRWDPQPYVSVLGEVNRPGRYEMIAPTTLVQLLAAAGGFTSFARKNHVELRRHAYDGRVVRVYVAAEEITEGKAPDVPLYPGDVVLVTGRYY